MSVSPTSEAQRIAQIIIDAPDEWTPHFTRSELLPLAKALAVVQALREERDQALYERDQANLKAAGMASSADREQRRAVAAEAAVVALTDRAEDAKKVLRECDEAGRDLTASLLAVRSHLMDTYPDDSRWTPWTRFIERPLLRLEAARKSARAALSVPPDEETP